MSELKKTDPRVRFANLREDQRSLIDKVEDHRKQIEVLLEQLKALNVLLAEAANEIEVEGFRETIHEERVQREEVIESLDDLVQDTRSTLQASRPSRDQVEYLNINAQQLSVASSTNSIERLYQLADTTRPWTEDEAKEFFSIQSAVLATRDYELSSGLQQAVDETYQAIKTIKGSRGEDIKLNYKPMEKMKTPDMMSVNVSSTYQQNNS